MGVMHIVWSLIVGFIVGLVARAVTPGADQMGLLATSLLGIIGSFIGGFLGSAIWKPKEGASVHPAGFILSVVGAVLLLIVWRQLH